MKKRDFINILILILTYVLIILLLTKGKYLYGSKTDWLGQHVRIADYFRTLFYEHKKLIPNFGFNLSAGVNIFTYSYYGFLNPIILISYLLPFVSMTTYIQISSIILTIISTILTYTWLKKHYSYNVSFTGAFLYLCATPIIFHSHRHIMFVNYMPFLIMALMGVERYFDKKKSGLLIISTFLIIMTSYFYSVGSLICITVYGIYYYLKNNDFEFKTFLKDGLKFALRIINSIMLAAFFLLPTAYVIKTGRIETNVSLNVLNIIIPSINTKLVLYGSYAMGLTSIFIVAIVISFMKDKKESIFLSTFFTLVIVFPLITYLLNGGMYLDGKALIPLLPIAIYLISYSLCELKNIDVKLLTKILIVLDIIILIFDYNLVFLIDSIIMLIVLNIKNQKVLMISLMIIPLSVTIMSSSSDKLIEKSIVKEDIKLSKIYINIDYDKYRTLNMEDNLNTLNKIYDSNQYKLSSYSSTLNKDYWEFYFKTFDNENSNRNFLMFGKNKNVLFNMYMGSKYIVGKKGMIGYEKIDKNVYKNEDVFPIGYASSNLMSLKEFNKLKYPDNIDALFNYIIVDKASKTDFKSDMEKIDLDYRVIKQKNLNIKKNAIISNDGYMKLHLNNDLNNKILIIKFNIDNDQECLVGDLNIDINGISNKLTCKEWKYYNNNKTFTYVLSANDLNIKFKKGKYVIKNIETYVIDYDKIKDAHKDLDEFKIKEISDKIVGDIDVKNDGYMTLSIPYDEGFNIYVDSKKIKYEKVNTAFIGFKIKKGKHHIKIEYKSPYLKEGKIISLLGLLLFIITITYERCKK